MELKMSTILLDGVNTPVKTEIKTTTTVEIIPDATLQRYVPSEDPIIIGEVEPIFDKNGTLVGKVERELETHI
jgi:hypothetical protein